jgi:hypothetical protein
LGKAGEHVLGLDGVEPASEQSLCHFGTAEDEDVSERVDTVEELVIDLERNDHEAHESIPCASSTKWPGTASE